MTQQHTLTDADRQDAAIIWDYHHMHHELRPCIAAICLGGPDPGLPELAANLWTKGLFPTLLFTGANSPDTIDWYPNGEAAGLREGAVNFGVPSDAILIEPHATNSGANIELSRRVLAYNNIEVTELMVISMPYMQRRAFATTRNVWPEVRVVCASEQIDFDTYAERISNPRLALDMIVGDLQRIMIYPEKGFAILQEVPPHVLDAYQRLVEAGYTSRLAAA